MENKTIMTETNIEGSTVTLSKPGITPITGTTEENGIVSLTDVPAGTYALTVSKTGYDNYTHPTSIVVPEDGTTLNVKCNLTPETPVTPVTPTTYNFNVQLTSPAAEGFTGTLVKGTDTPLTAESTSGGLIAFTGLESGEYTLTITKTGWQTHTGTITIPTDESTSVTMQEEVTTLGVLNIETSPAVVGATVNLNSDGTTHATTTTGDTGIGSFTNVAYYSY